MNINSAIDKLGGSTSNHNDPIQRICVIGLGRIGLPLALLLADKGYEVVGLDVSKLLLEDINEIKLNEKIFEEEIRLLKKYLNVSFSVTNDLNVALSKSEAVFIAIGTGIMEDGTPDLSPLTKLISNLCEKPENIANKLIILKSTIPIGTTRELASKIEEYTNLKVGRDFFMAFCPERVLGDKAIYEMTVVPKIIGALDEISKTKAISIYKKLGGKIIVVNTTEEAELIKLIDNSYRQTMFAFANDISLITSKLGINCYELIKNANDDYPRNKIPQPSGGVSGYCLTKDPLYLETFFKDISAERGHSSVWYAARKSNDYMPRYMVNLLKEKMEKTGKQLKDSNVLVCGITYKENTDDTRFSHGFEIVNYLRKEGANVLVWDPLIRRPIKDYHFVDKPDEILSSLDALIFTVKHKEFLELCQDNRIVEMLSKMRTPILIDGWGIFQSLNSNPNVIYSGIGV